MSPREMACFVSSAVVRTPSSFDILALWNSIVFTVTLIADAISLLDLPSATNCKTSLWRRLSVTVGVGVGRLGGSVEDSKA